MRLKKIITYRGEGRGVDFDIVYEWEDMIASSLDVPFYYDNPEQRWKSRLCRLFPFYAKSKVTNEMAFMFVMQPLLLPNGTNKKNIIPCIIDFYEKSPEKLQEFYKKYERNPVVLISSREVVDFLKAQNCPLKIIHWGLSISDKYEIKEQTSYAKKYDIIMMGRQNPKFVEWVERYSLNHHVSVLTRHDGDMGMGYYSNDGTFITSAKSREEYIALMRSCRIGLYATPGMDGGDLRTNGFNQVTPRFLEYVSSQCHIVARYSKNSDTDYYELETICASIETYEQFEERIDYCLTHEIDKAFYANYLSKHYTSSRISELKLILENI